MEMDWVVALRNKKARFKQWLFAKADPAKTSRFGIVLQILGLLSAMEGVYMIYPPASFIIAGVLAVFIGEKV